MDTDARILERKLVANTPNGIDVAPTELHPTLFPCQRDIVSWGLQRGRAAIGADTGLGKTPQRLDVAMEIAS